MHNWQFNLDMDIYKLNLDIYKLNSYGKKLNDLHFTSKLHYPNAWNLNYPQR